MTARCTNTASVRAVGDRLGPLGGSRISRVNVVLRVCRLHVVVRGLHVVMVRCSLLRVRLGMRGGFLGRPAVQHGRGGPALQGQGSHHEPDEEQAQAQHERAILLAHGRFCMRPGDGP